MTLIDPATLIARASAQAGPARSAHPAAQRPTVTVVQVDLVTRTKGLVTIRGTDKCGTVLHDAERDNDPGSGWSAEDGDGQVLATRQLDARDAAIACAREQGITGRITVEIDEEYRRTGARA